MTVVQRSPALDSVMAAFRPWTGSFSNSTIYARYLVGPRGLDAAQGIVDQITQSELRGFGLDNRFVDVRPLDGERGIIGIGPFDSTKIKFAALFKRMDEFFPGKRLPENLSAVAKVLYPKIGSDALSILNIFGAFRAAGWSIESGDFFDPLTKPRGLAHIGNSQNTLTASVERQDVKVLCKTTIQYYRPIDKGVPISGPLQLAEGSTLDQKMTFAAFLPSHYVDSLEGYEAMTIALREIFDPLVSGASPLVVRSMGEDLEDSTLVVSINGEVPEDMVRAASEELGIGFDSRILGFDE
jgi:hypothetical protein